MKTWIEALESATTVEAGRQALPSPLTADDASDYFGEIVQAIGSSPMRAQSLTGRWKLFDQPGPCRAWALRMKGVGERLAGSWSKSATTLQAAGDAATEPRDKWLFKIGAIDSLARCGKVAAAVKLANAISSGLVQIDSTREAARAQLNLGNALLWHDRYSPARKAFRLALDWLDVDDEVYRAAANLGLSTCELFGGELSVSKDHANTAVRELETLGMSAHAAVAKTNLGHAALLSGRLDEAAEHFLAARASLDPDSHDFARAEEFLGDAYLRMNLLTEAEDAFNQALSHPTVRSGPLNRANVELGLGLVHLAKGDFKSASSFALKSERHYFAFGNLVWAGQALIVRSEALRKSGRARKALKASQSAFASIKKGRSRGLLAGALIEVASAKLMLGEDISREINALGRALAGRPDISKSWRYHHLRAQSQGGSSALRHYRRMATAIWDARTLTESVISRGSYLNDKSEALSSYLGVLLADGRPKFVREALGVVRQARSVALLEEIAGALALDGSVETEEIQLLREELNATGDPGPSGAARKSSPQKKLSSLVRRWTEANLTVRTRLTVPPVGAGWPDIVLVSSSRGAFALSGSHARQLNVRGEDLESAWRWLKFELFAPLADRQSDPRVAITALENIRDLIGLSFESSSTTLSPEGQFWQVPWSAIAALNSGSEAVLSSGPWSANCKESIPHDPRSVIWYQSHPGLPLIDQEVDNFMTNFPGSRVCRTVKEVRACLADGPVDLLHVASHASFHRENPMFSAFSFESGKVTAAEIARSSFRPGIVVLSACETGMVSTQRPAEPEGFARAFLARGATSVITSFWPLDDQAACVFSQILYSNLKLGHSVVDSTAAARSGVRSKMGHPYFWGPFTLFGGYVS